MSIVIAAAISGFGIPRSLLGFCGSGSLTFAPAAALSRGGFSVVRFCGGDFTWNASPPEARPGSLEVTRDV